MTFDEWFDSGGTDDTPLDYANEDGPWVLTLRICWQAAQREAAKRCAEICKLRFIGDRRLEDVGVICGETIEREFGLDKS